MKSFNIPPNGGIPALIKGLKFNFYEKPRTLMPLLSLKERQDSFNEIELGFNENLALEEANRCLGCDLRFEISPMCFQLKNGWN